MTGYYLTFNSGIDFEAFGSLKIGNKKLKQQDWFVLEPQTLSFEIMYYDVAQSVQETESNRIIDSIFTIGTSVKGIVQNAVFRLYYNETLIFTGIVDLTQSDHNIITKDSKIFCYDYLKILSMIKDDGFEIIDNSLLFGEFITGTAGQSIQEIINEYSITTVTFNVAGTAPDMTLPEPGYINTDNVMPYKGFQTYRYTYMEWNETAKCIYIGWFHFNRGFINYGTPSAEVVSVQGESGLYRLDGLTYFKIYVRTDNIIPIPDGTSNSFNWATTQQASVGNVHRLLLGEYMTYINGGLPETDSLVNDGLTYTYESPAEDSAAYKIKIEGDMFSYRHAFGRFLEYGYDEENKSNVIDVLKMFLILRNSICYADGTVIKIRPYLDYTTSHTISDDDIADADKNYLIEKGIKSIPATSGNTELLLSAINSYYHNNISDETYPVKILKAGNENIKAGDQVTNSTYNLDLFIIELKTSPDDMYIEILGV